MALLPTIPTSFVPRTGLAARPHVSADFGSALALLSYILLALSFFLALGVFFYGRILAGTLVNKDAELAKAEAAIDPATVHSFVQLRDRLSAGQALLHAHMAPSAFFTAIESILPSTVRFSSLHLVVDGTGAARVDGVGVSKSFNALSAASEAFANDGRLKDVIFSKMTINARDNSVSFSFSATLSPELITYMADGAGTEDTGAAAPTL
jgi:hypothetical protein